MSRPQRRTRALGLLVGVFCGIFWWAVSWAFGARAYGIWGSYAAIAIYGLVVFALRYLIGDFAAGQKRWAVGLQSILGMWWGVTVLVPLALTIQILAYLNHRVLRRILTSS
jgi:hypothetical protein